MMTATAWILAAAVVVASVVASSSEDSRLELGRLQYELAKSDSRIPRYGDCWKSAVRDLEEGCKRLTDDEQGRDSVMESILVNHQEFTSPLGTGKVIEWMKFFLYELKFSPP